MDDDKRLSYFFLGLGLGVAVGMLFAPKSGEETREFLKQKADEGTKELQCVKATLLASLQGYAPAVAVEAADG